MTWQPIETAPRDATRVLLCRVGYRENIAAAFWDIDWDCWYTVGGNIFNHPTHWMPLPEPPQEGQS